MVLFFMHILFVVNRTINTTPPERLQQHPLLFTTNHSDRTFFVWRLNSARPPHPGHNTILLRSDIPSGICAKLRKQWNSHAMITLRVRCCYVQSLTSLVSPEITRHDHSIIACSRHIYEWCCSSRTSRSWWITHSTQHHRRGCNTSKVGMLR